MPEQPRHGALVFRTQSILRSRTDRQIDSQTTPIPFSPGSNPGPYQFITCRPRPLHLFSYSSPPAECVSSTNPPKKAPKSQNYMSSYTLLHYRNAGRGPLGPCLFCGQLDSGCAKTREARQRLLKRVLGCLGGSCPSTWRPSFSRGVGGGGGGAALALGSCPSAVAG